MKKTLLNITRDCYYIITAILIKVVSRESNLFDYTARALGYVRYHLGYIGIKNGRSFFLDIIRKSFPEKSSDAVIQVLKNFWVHHQKFFMELFLFIHLDENFVNKQVSFNGIEYLDQALAKNRGVVLAVPHMGNERLIHLALAIKKYPISVITGDFSDAGTFVRKIRLQSTLKHHELFFPYDSPRKYFKFLSSNGVLQVSPPADPLKKETLVSFLNHRINLSYTAFRIAQLSGSLLVPALCTRIQQGYYKIYFHKPLILNKQCDKNYKFQEEINSVYKWYESYIRKYPGQFNWIWLAKKVGNQP